MKTDKVDKQELLSALIDGQLDEQQIQQSLDMLLEDEELQMQWLNMHRVNTIYQSKMDDQLAIRDISSNISTRLENEPAHFVEDAVSLTQPQVKKVDWHERSSFFKAGVGVAIAASVMFVTLNISQLLNQTEPNFVTPASEQMAGLEGSASSATITDKQAIDQQTTTQHTAPAYVASKLSDSARIPFAQTATFSQYDNVSGQTVSSNVISYERKKQYPLSTDKVKQLTPNEETARLENKQIVEPKPASK